MNAQVDQHEALVMERAPRDIGQDGIVTKWHVVALISRQDGRDNEGRRTMAEPGLILVTGAGGGVGGVGGKKLALLRQRGRAVRAMAHTTTTAPPCGPRRRRRPR